MTPILDPHGRPLVHDPGNGGPLETLHPRREQGMLAGRASAGDDDKARALYDQVVDAALTFLAEERDDNLPTPMHEATYEHFIGFVDGWGEAMAVTPLLFLTRQQTMRVQQLPRAVRVPWRAEYDKGVKRWQRAGGRLSGKRPILPAIPGG